MLLGGSKLDNLYGVSALCDLNPNGFGAVQELSKTPNVLFNTLERGEGDCSVLDGSHATKATQGNQKMVEGVKTR